ncbi:Cystatin-like protein [Aphelenchoides besseyi]|nr:Cystatin-like protein [Aphelenchoides besseyi]KAI6201700.1 Cystatin-like protein [Aphelenchoides besseyi]
MTNISNLLLTVLLLFVVSSILITMALGEVYKEGMVGGWSEEDVNSDLIKGFAKKAVNKLNKLSNDMHQHIVTKILRAQSQVVSGNNYKIKAEFGLTNCKKGEICGENEPVQSKKVYNIKVFEQPWTRTEEITFTEA